MRVLPFVFAAGALFGMINKAHAQDLALPSGSILDINNGAGPNDASYATANVFQNYSVSFTAADSGNNYILFAFRQDPAYWTFGNVSMVLNGSSTNLLVDPTFTQGGTVSSQSGLQAPANWGIVYQSGATPDAAGQWYAPGQAPSPGYSTTNVNSGTAGSWYDGAVGSFDGIYQGVNLVAGDTYTISFSALSNNIANVSGSGSGGVELGVFAGPCASLSGSTADCTPDNPNFISLATPGQTANAGSTATNIDANDAAAGLAANPATLLPVFDGGTLVLDGTDLTPYSFTITNNNGTVDLAGQSATISNPIADDTAGVPGSLTVANSGSGGALTLTGTNTYTGGTTIDTGATLALSGAGSIAASSRLVDNGTFDISAASGASSLQSLNGTGTVNLGANNLALTNASGAFSGTIQGTGEVVMNGGTEALSGTNTYSGGTTLNGGTLQVSQDDNLGNASGALTFNGGTLENTGSFTTTRNINLVGNANFNTDAGTTLTDTAGAITGSGSINKQGAGTLILGNDDATGGITVAAGALQLTGASAATGVVGVASGATLSLTGSGSITNASDVVNNGTFDISGAHSDQSISGLSGNGTVALGSNGLTFTDSNDVYSGTINGSGGVRMNGGAQELSGTNTYTGGTALNSGVLVVSSDANLGDATGALNFNGGTLESTASFTTSRDINATGSANFHVDSGTTLTDTAGTLSGNGPINKTGAGTLVLGADNSTGGVNVGAGTLQLTQASTDAGVVGVANGATLALTGNGSIANAAGVVNDGMLDISGANSPQSITSLAGSGTVELGSNGLTLTHANDIYSGTIDGHAGVTLDSGVEAFSGANTYTGGTTINNGTLQVDSDASLGDASGALKIESGTLHSTATFTSTRDIAMADAANFNVDTGTTLTDTAGAITGNGPINKLGGGTLVLGADHSTGGMNVGAGTLQLAGASTDTGASNVASGATLAIVGSGSDASASSVNNGGTFDISQANSAQSIGSLAGNGTVNLGSNGLTLTNANGNFGGTIGGHGGITLGGGTEVLSGTNTYTGGTTLNGGNLVVSNDANLGATGTPVTFNGGTLTVTQSMNTSRDFVINNGGATFNTINGATVQDSGAISGTGGLVKTGDGTLVVSGNNTFTGGTLIDGGVVKIDSGSSLGTGAILLNGGTLQTTATLNNNQNVWASGNAGVNVDSGTTTVMAGTIQQASGSGCFVKSGSGTLNFTGTQILSGGTCVQDGMLRANGNLVSNVQVYGPGELRGTGVIEGPINVSGRLAPGNSPGTLTVAGTVTMNAGSTYEEDIDGLGMGTGAGNYSRLVVTGENNQFIANGTLVPLLRGITGNASNSYTPQIGDVYQIVMAQGGIVGQFSALTQPDGLAAHTRFVAFYNVNHNHSIELSVVPDSYASLLTGAGANRNALSVAGALDKALNLQAGGIASSGQSELLYALAGAKAGQLASVLTNLSGEIYADEAAAGRAAGLAMQSDTLGHLGTDDSHVEGEQQGHLAWANVTHDGNRWSGDAQGSGFQTGTNQSTAGMDLYASNGSVVGVAVSNHDTDVNAGAQQGTIRGYDGIVYGQQAVASVLIDGMVAHGHDTWITRRPDPTGVAGNLYSRAAGNNSMADLTVRMPMTAGSMRLEPYASVTWLQFDRGGMSEGASSPAALQVARLSATGTRALLGVNLGSMQQDPLQSEVTYRVGAAVGEDSRGLLSPAVQATLGSESFSTQAPRIGRGFVQVQANGTLRLSHAAYLYGGMTDELGARRGSYGVTAGVRVSF